MVQEQVMNELRKSFLGDRLALMVTSSAPMSEEVKLFLKKCFVIPVFELYGQTEAGFIAFDGKVLIERYKLVSVPELGYLLTDKPYPRGELHIDPAGAIRAYYKNPE